MIGRRLNSVVASRQREIPVRLSRTFFTGRTDICGIFPRKTCASSAPEVRWGASKRWRRDAPELPCGLGEKGRRKLKTPK